MLRLSRAQLREVDRISIEEYGLPGIVLMENAAHHAAGWIDVARRMPGEELVACIVCGGGNNGGDGYAIARLLHNAGWTVSIIAVGPIESLKGDAAIMAHVAHRMRLPITEDLARIAATRGQTVIDAITGTGLSRPLEGRGAAAANAVNTCEGRVVAIDVPSGLDCDTGEPLAETCVRADVTVTFVAEKIGFANPRSREFTGTVHVGNIGCPRAIIDRISASR